MTESSQNSTTTQAAGDSGCSSKLKSSGDAQICISFMCNFSIRLVKQQPYKSCSFAQAGDQVLHRMILEGEKKKREEKRGGGTGAAVHERWQIPYSVIL